MIGRHPRLQFQCFLGSRHTNQAWCTLARELPNLSLAGYWWHNFFPDAVRQVMAERLEMLPVNKQVGFFSDAYCVQWVYGETRLVEKQIARVLGGEGPSRPVHPQGRPGNRPQHPLRITPNPSENEPLRHRQINKCHIVAFRSAKVALLSRSERPNSSVLSRRSSTQGVPHDTPDYVVYRPMGRLPLETLAPMAKSFGFDGLELACSGDHFEVDKALADPCYCDNHRKILEHHGMQLFSISNHLVGQAILDHVNARHKSILPAYVWGDGNPAGVNARAAEAMKDAARAAKKMGISVVNGFTGSSIWPLLYSFPRPAGNDRRGFRSTGRAVPSDPGRLCRVCGVKFAWRSSIRRRCPRPVHGPAGIEVLDYRPEFGFNFDPAI